MVSVHGIRVENMAVFDVAYAKKRRKTTGVRPGTFSKYVAVLGLHRTKKGTLFH